MGFSCSSGTGFTFVSNFAAGGGGLSGAVVVTLGGAALKGSLYTGCPFGNPVSGSAWGFGGTVGCFGLPGGGKPCGAGFMPGFGVLKEGMVGMRRLKLEPVAPNGQKHKNAVGDVSAGSPDSILIPAAFPVANGFRGETMFASLLK